MFAASQVLCAHCWCWEVSVQVMCRDGWTSAGFWRLSLIIISTWMIECLSEAQQNLRASWEAPGSLLCALRLVPMCCALQTSWEHWNISDKALWNTGGEGCLWWGCSWCDWLMETVQGGVTAVVWAGAGDRSKGISVTVTGTVSGKRSS